MNKRYAEIKDNKVVAVFNAAIASKHYADSQIVELDQTEAVEVGYSYDNILFTKPEKPEQTPVHTLPEPRPKSIYKSYTYNRFLKSLTDVEAIALLEQKNISFSVEWFILKLELFGIDFNQEKNRTTLATLSPLIFTAERLNKLINNA